MAYLENTYQVPTPNLIFHRKYYGYAGSFQRVVYVVEEFHLDDCRIICRLTPRAFLDLQ